MRIFHRMPRIGAQGLNRMVRPHSLDRTGRSLYPIQDLRGLWDTFTNQLKPVLPTFEEHSKLHNLISMCPTDIVEVVLFLWCECTSRVFVEHEVTDNHVHNLSFLPRRSCHIFGFLACKDRAQYINEFKIALRAVRAWTIVRVRTTHHSPTPPSLLRIAGAHLFRWHP